MINDPILAKELCIKYFENFSDHRVFMDTTNDELIGRSLVCLTGQNWRNMRNILSPIFTGAKIRKMFDLMNVCNINAIESLKSQIKIEQILEMKEFFTNFAVDIIFSTAFGLEVNSFQNPKNKLKEIALRTSNPNPFMMQLKLAGINLFPKVMKKFNIGLMDQNTTEFFRTTILDTMKYREKHNVYRSDMIQLLMEARKELVEKGEFLSDEDIIGQCLLFFLAGFENLSTIMAFGAYELAVNWEIQQKLRQSVDFEEVFEYENIHKLKYLDQFVSEVLRKWPPAPLIERRCTKDCTFNVDDQSVTIEKEKFFFVPVYAFHHNPNYFENPEKFDPDRFIEQNISDAYIPFGIGNKF
jgi:cytochrome P450 family 9